MIRWLATWAAAAGMATSVWAGPIPPPVQNASPFPLFQLFSGPAQTPHPAVVRVVVQERSGLSLGSGALVAVQGDYGLVLTNWHVVRDAAGPITVLFPDGFRSGATILKVDPLWDLAALAIWRPQVEPIRLAADMPRLGEALTIVGYGSGQYRAATGRCIQYLSPAPNEPPEMLELSVAARQGDSGGPILNTQGELVGVLFGASWGRTAGSSCPRVRAFLTPLSAWFSLPGTDFTFAAAASCRPPAGSPPHADLAAYYSAEQTPPSALPAGMNLPGTESSGASGWPTAAPSGRPPSEHRSGSSLMPSWLLPPNGPPSTTHQTHCLETPPPQGPSGQNKLPPAAIPWSTSQTNRSPQVWAGSSRTNPLASTPILPPLNSPQNPTPTWRPAWPATSPTAALPSPSPNSNPLDYPGQNTSRFEAIKNFLAFVGAVALLLLAVRILTPESTH